MSRFRTRGVQATGTWNTKDYSPQGELQSNVTSGTGALANGVIETILDSSVTNFKKLRAEGRVFMNPVTQTFDSRTTIPSNWTFGTHVGWGRREITGDVAAYIASYSGMAPPDWSEKVAIARDEAIIKAYAKVASSNAEVLVSVAEAGKTARMMKDPFQRSRQLVTDLVGTRLRLLKKGLKYADATVSAYLEVRFGFQPVIYDFQNISKAYLSKPNNSPVRLVARSSVKFSSDKSDTWSTSFPGTTSVLIGRASSLESKIAVGVLYELTETMDEARARNYGLRLVDVPSALYELVPFSFVLDRYVRVGDWLKAIIPKPGVVEKGKWITTTGRTLNTFTVLDALIHIGNTPETDFHQSGGSYAEVIRSKDRSSSFSLPTMPTLNTSEHTLLQLVDEAALIAQVFKTFDVKQLRRWETYAPKQRWVSLYRRHPTL